MRAKRQDQLLTSHVNRPSRLLLVTESSSFSTLSKSSYLFSFGIMVANPFLQTRSPVLNHVGFGILDSLPITKSTLRFARCYHMHRLQVDLDPFLRFGGGLLLRTPSAPILVCSDAATIYI